MPNVRAMRWAAPLASTLIMLCVAGSAAQDRKLVPAAPEAAGRRVALVVGNDSYPEMPLRNARNDMRALAAALREVGFAVTELPDTDRKALARGIDAFIQAVRAGDTALFYYSGHGMQLDGQNYLVPVDFAGADAVDAQYDAYPVERLVGRLSSTGVGLAIVILDACRNNPFRGVRASGGGWAGMQAGRGVYLAFATAPGTVASDNPAGGNGLFTTHLLAALREPGLTLDEVFGRVGPAVRASSGGRQDPWVSASAGAGGMFRFRPAAEPSARAQPPVTAAPDPELVAWQAVAGTTNVAVLEQFVAAFPNGQYAAAARVKIAALREPAPVAPPSGPPTATPKPNTADLIANGEAAYKRGDYVDALGWYRKAADAGDPAAMLTVGKMLMTGVPTDLGRLTIWGNKSMDAMSSGVSATTTQGFIRDDPRWVNKDERQAAEWFRKAAEAGETPAMAYLGVMYENGRGVPKDLEQAVAWYRRAAAAGNKEAQDALKRLGR